MDSGLAGFLGAFWLGLVLLGIALLIAWIVLPFAIIGSKPILREILAESKKTNALLLELRKQAAGAHVAPPAVSDLPQSLRTAPLFTAREVPHVPGAIGSDSPPQLKP
jgi:hypothetical protein